MIKKISRFISNFLIYIAPIILVLAMIIQEYETLMTSSTLDFRIIFWLAFIGIILEIVYWKVIRKSIKDLFHNKKHKNQFLAMLNGFMALLLIICLIFVYETFIKSGIDIVLFLWTLFDLEIVGVMFYIIGVEIDE